MEITMMDNAMYESQVTFASQLLVGIGNSQNMGKRKPTVIQKFNFSKWFKVFHKILYEKDWQVLHLQWREPQKLPEKTK